MSDEMRIAALERLVDAFNRQDVEAALALFTDDAVFLNSRGPDPWGRRFEGKEEIRSGIESRFAAIPVGAYQEVTHVVFGDRGHSEWTLRGMTAEGEAIDVRGCDLWTFDGDRIAGKNSFWKIVEQ
ncbi:MAG TPA: nuclear transport factor 2 family protein [Gaiellaceae bacterium]|jgi:taurine dehydrogenase small subunit|nr:nuclear transport factor 2 family protein [Gaiellaceae bacterium]